MRAVRAALKLLSDKGTPVVLGVAALLAITAVQLIGGPQLGRLGLLLFDVYQRAAPRPYEDAPVSVVDIDDETIRRLGQWPWPRTDVADLTRRLVDAGAAVVVYDIVFSEPDRTSPARLADRMERGAADPRVADALRALPDNDTLLAQTFAEAPVVLAYFLERGAKGETVEPKAGIALGGSPPNAWKFSFTSAIQPLPELRAAASGLGFVSRVGDEDGIVRQAPLILDQNGQLLPSLSIEALRVAQQAGSVLVKTSDASGELGGGGRVDVAAVKVADFEVPTTPAGELWMHYTRPHPGRVVAAWRVLSGAMPPAELERAFAGNIVFVGAGAVGLRDLVATPLADRELGVMIHAQAAEQMILGRFLSRPYWAPVLESMLLPLLGLVLALMLPWLGAARGALLAVVMVGGLGLGSWLAFSEARLLLDPSYPILGLVLVYLVETGFTFYREERQRAYIHQAFDRYLSPELVKRIVDDPGRLELGGEEREMTVLFADIRGFSRISEKLDPQQLIRFLIAFLTPMCAILLGRKATIDKFIGDAILAFWNAPLDDPDHHRNAARGALEMLVKLRQLNADASALAREPWPGDVRIGIGLNTGRCCVGNMGSAQRLSYSLIGDTVNLTSRLEGLTKYLGVEIAIGEDLAAALPDFAVVELDRVRVVGREAPETVSALLGDETLAAEPRFAAFVPRHMEMLAAYRAQDWRGALSLIGAGEDTADALGLGRFYTVMRDRVSHFRADPPGRNWDGVFSALEK